MKLSRLPKEFDVTFFWEKVDQCGADECWTWQATVNSSGYGQIGVPGHGIQLAHRVSWCIHFQEIPAGWCVLHRCDNPPCVNPLHLFLGNNKLNMMDCVAKGRKPDLGHLVQGEKNGCAKLSEEDVREMRRLHLINGLSGYRLAKQFGIHKQHAYDILAKRYWAHV